MKIASIKLMRFIWLIAFIFCNNKDLSYFLDKDIRIFVSTANHIFLAKDTRNDIVLPKSKFSNIDNVFSEFKIMRDGSEYRLFSGDHRICAISSKIISKCEKPKTWKISPATLGYTLVMDGKCLTINSYEKAGMSACTNSDDQIFDFKLADEDTACDDDKKNKKKEEKKEPQKIIINLNSDILKEVQEPLPAPVPVHDDANLIAHHEALSNLPVKKICHYDTHTGDLTHACFSSKDELKHPEIQISHPNLSHVFNPSNCNPMLTKPEFDHLPDIETNKDLPPINDHVIAHHHHHRHHKPSSHLQFI